MFLKRGLSNLSCSPLLLVVVFFFSVGFGYSWVVLHLLLVVAYIFFNRLFVCGGGGLCVTLFLFFMVVAVEGVEHGIQRVVHDRLTTPRSGLVAPPHTRANDNKPKVIISIPLLDLVL